MNKILNKQNNKGNLLKVSYFSTFDECRRRYNAT